MAYYGARDRLFAAEDVAFRLALDVETVRVWLRTGRLPGVKVGRGWRVRESDLEAIIRAGTGGAGAG